MSRFLPLCLLSLAFALPASAQQSPPSGPPPRPDMTKMIAREGDDMALLLGLTAAQRPALDAFLKSFGPPPLMERPEGTSPPDAASAERGPMTFADHLAMMEKNAASHATEERARIAAARTFYNSLDTRQRSLFEALQRLRHGPGPGAGRGRFGPGPFGMAGGPGMPPHGGDGPSPLPR